MRLLRTSLVLLWVLLVSASASACIWDYDTLQMERRAFPGAIELITGKFLRHGEAFYRWRIADREARLVRTPEDLALYDDLATAYEKTGDPRKAIEIMLDKEKRKSGLYTTEANLGTFYIHAGDLEQGLVHIGKAIEINPEAHFGREIFQRRLVEYVLKKRSGAELTLPLLSASRAHGVHGFAAFVLAPRSDDAGMEPSADEKAMLRAARKGVLGMMRFGRFDSPVLLEALGDLLVAEGMQEGGRRLACRAYLKASFGQEGLPHAAYRLLAKSALSSQTVAPGSTTSLTLEQVERSLRAELKEAETWHAAVLENERAWIAAGENPEARFDETYYGAQAEVIKGELPAPAVESRPAVSFLLLGVVAFLIVLAVVVFALQRRPEA